MATQTPKITIDIQMIRSHFLTDRRWINKSTVSIWIQTTINFFRLISVFEFQFTERTVRSSEPERWIFTEEEWTFAHGLETWFAVIEESTVSSSQQDQHTFFGLHFTTLDLRLQITSTFTGDGLNDSSKKKEKKKSTTPLFNNWMTKTWISKE